MWHVSCIKDMIFTRSSITSNISRILVLFFHSPPGMVQDHLVILNRSKKACSWPCSTAFWTNPDPSAGRTGLEVRSTGCTGRCTWLRIRSNRMQTRYEAPCRIYEACAAWGFENGCAYSCAHSYSWTTAFRWPWRFLHIGLWGGWGRDGKFGWVG